MTRARVESGRRDAEVLSGRGLRAMIEFFSRLVFSGAFDVRTLYRCRALWIIALLILLAPGDGAGDDKTTAEVTKTPDDKAAAEVTKTPDYDEFVVIPLRVHILTAADLPEVDCHLTDADITRILTKSNRIWEKAGIHWGLETVVHEPAAELGKFRLAREMNDPRNLGLYRILLPENSRAFDGLHVYYLHRFPVNGVWLGDEGAVVQETASLRPVEGGIDEPIPRVTAHELGHALGLKHRQDRTNLLASGTTGTSLNTKEIETARRTARTIKGAATVADLRARAEGAARDGARDQARRIWTWLAELPGDAASEARRRLDQLPSGNDSPAKP
jgi:hypothetical protein